MIGLCAQNNIKIKHMISKIITCSPKLMSLARLMSKSQKRQLPNDAWARRGRKNRRCPQAGERHISLPRFRPPPSGHILMETASGQSCCLPMEWLGRLELAMARRSGSSPPCIPHLPRLRSPCDLATQSTSERYSSSLAAASA
jgi:hypothetical protein